MKKIDWYIIRKFLGTFVYSLLLIIVIVIIFDISEKIDDFIENKAPLNSIIFDYYFKFVPYFVNMFSALFTFISVIYFTSRMASNTEIIAIFNSGMSFRRMLMPYLGVALLIGLLNLYLANFLMPDVNKDRIKFENKYLKNAYYNSNQNIHMQYDKNTYYYVESFDNNSNTGARFSMEKITDSGLTYKITADIAQYDTNTEKWTLYNYFGRTISGYNETIEKGPSLLVDYSVKPEDFAYDLINVASLKTPKLIDYINQEKMRGSTYVKMYEYEKWQRISHPFAAVVLTVIGFSLSCRKMRGGTGLHLALGIGIAFAFLLFMQISRVFATFGSFPVWLAAWLPIITFGLFALILAYKTPK